MVESQVRARGVRDEAVLSAMLNVPRHVFVRESHQNDAYADAALPADCVQTISQPYMVARMTELLGPLAGKRILEIGTGTGYQTAVLARLAAHVWSIEWHLRLMCAASERLAALNLRNVTLRCGDGSLGWPEHAPFDGILVTAGAPGALTTLQEQLAVGGCLIAPIGDEKEQTLVRAQRTEGGFTEERLFACRFVKLRGRQGWREN